MPRKNFAKLHLKIRIFVPVKSKASRKPKNRLHMLRNPGRTPNTREKPALLLPKLLGFALQFFIFRVCGGPWHSGLPSRYASAHNILLLKIKYVCVSEKHLKENFYLKFSITKKHKSVCLKELE